MNYETIIEQLKHKDPQALESLYNTYGAKFYDYCIRKWQLSEDAAWEAVYQTLETVVLKGAQYQFESNLHFQNFLFKVLLNFLRQLYRKQKAGRSALEFVELDTDGDISVVQRKIDKKTFTDYYQSESVEPEIMRTLNHALSQLAPADKDLLLLKAQNYTYDEIAEILGVENNQLKVKHHRAKQKLIKLLNEASL